MLRVVAAPGVKVPCEDKPGQFIGAASVDVPDTMYYRRRLATGELRLAYDDPPVPLAPPPVASLPPPDIAQVVTNLPSKKSRS